MQDGDVMLTVDEIWQILAEIPDPEIPTVSLVELGIARSVDIGPDDEIVVTITPTFSGCPALHVMKQEIVARLSSEGQAVQVSVIYSPPWTTDWITESAREKLRIAGIAPARHHGGNFEVVLLDAALCPYCGSERTSLRNSFGPTPCRMIYYCNACQQPFEQFKPL